MKLLSYFSLKLPIYFVYMLQQVEYKPRPFLHWLGRMPNLRHVMHRKTLVWTRKAQVLVAISYGAATIFAGLIVLLAVHYGWLELVLLVITPLIALEALLVTIIAGLMLNSRTHGREIAASEQLFAKHSAVKIAIAGSYGKTTIKELLRTVLSEGKNVAATPGNKNVSISHARWARTLSGDEEVLLIEYGEGAPGDVARFAAITHPTIGIIAGLAPNHLEEYKTLAAVGEDLFALADYLDGKNTYVNKECQPIKPYLKDSYYIYDHTGVRGWTIKDVVVSMSGMKFNMRKGENSLTLHTGLVGRHLLGPLGLSVAIAHELGLTKEQIQAGMAKTQPFEHRMQPRQMGGAWVIDDAYNGNLEGIRAGLELLKELPAKRKIYVTPGLVDQGAETEAVHTEIGRLIAAAQPDKVILMQNSVTKYITVALHKAEFKGELQLESDPLEFYMNIEHFVAGGDLLLMQNDWTDNYA
jgi:UDP-N-acetylmuramoyl-tripeptide--D-alanyl-D-alanine ligase